MPYCLCTVWVWVVLHKVAAQQRHVGTGQVRREVREEAGVPVGAVHILGSQPWPVGEIAPVHASQSC